LDRGLSRLFYFQNQFEPIDAIRLDTAILETGTHALHLDRKAFAILSSEKACCLFVTLDRLCGGVPANRPVQTTGDASEMAGR